MLYELWGPALGAILLVILLFPDGWPPPGVWRRVAQACGAVLVLFMTALVTATLSAAPAVLLASNVILAAAALFNPLRRRVQRMVDRRFSQHG